ncbi:MAG: hypothetical protein MSA59_02250, partial [Lachnobacterium sp.]|nr:hypothetical protein [Lachnobacterium sp.]
EYLLTYTTLSDKLERLDKRIEELASKDEYRESVKKLCCFIGIKTHTVKPVNKPFLGWKSALLHTYYVFF